jgi:hypothetical protein
MGTGTANLHHRELLLHSSATKAAHNDLLAGKDGAQRSLQHLENSLLRRIHFFGRHDE